MSPTKSDAQPGTMSKTLGGATRPRRVESDSKANQKADLAGPGIGNYAELEKILPQDYTSLLTRKETQKAIFHLRRYIEDNLCKELGLQMVQVPLIVEIESGVNDMLDRDGSRTPIQFHISNDRNKNPIAAQVVQAATKWKRVALKQFDCHPGEGICTDARRPQRLLPRSRPLGLRRPMGLGARDQRRAAQCRISEVDCAEDMEGAGRYREIRRGDVPRAPRFALSQSA